MNVSQVNEIFEVYYQQLRDLNKENSPNSYIYFGETVESVVEESTQEFDGEFTEHLGRQNSEIVAVAVDLHNYYWYAIHANTTEESVRELFEKCGGEISNA